MRQLNCLVAWNLLWKSVNATNQAHFAPRRASLPVDHQHRLRNGSETQRAVMSLFWNPWQGNSFILPTWSLSCPLHVCMLSCFSHLQLCANLQTVAQQTPLSMGFCRQEYWSGFYSLLHSLPELLTESLLFLVVFILKKWKMLFSFWPSMWHCREVCLPTLITEKKWKWPRLK